MSRSVRHIIESRASGGHIGVPRANAKHALASFPQWGARIGAAARLRPAPQEGWGSFWTVIMVARARGCDVHPRQDGLPRLDEVQS
jgi:hypothetical protein